MQLQKKDFIEIEFTGKIKDSGEIFDSNIKEELEKIKSKVPAKPLIYCLGEGMFIEAIDNYLIGRDLGKYQIDLLPEQAFGKRDSSLIQRIPTKIFTDHNIRPVQGVSLNFDGKIGKIISISGGRVLVDFNSPLAGKEIIYNINVKRKVEDINEKLKAFNEFLFKREIQFEIKDKIVIYKVDEPLKKFIDLFKEKFKDIFNLDLEVELLETTKKEQ